MNPWLRWYLGTTEDGKFRVVARNASVTVATVMGVWAALLEDAAHPEHRGLAMHGTEFYGAVLDLSPDEVQAILNAMARIKLIHIEGDKIAVTQWSKRQFETDHEDRTGAERQRRWRERHRNGVTQTDSNVTVTDAKRSDTETEAETETEEVSSLRSETSTLSDGEGASEEAGAVVQFPNQPGRAKNGEEYAFECGVIRLIKRDLDRWKEAFPNINVVGELYALAGWAGRPENRKRWFHLVANALAKKDRETKAAREKAHEEAQANAEARARTPPPPPRLPLV